MHINNSNFQLAELIYKAIAGTLSGKEEEVLAKWRSNPENNELFIKITDSDEIYDKLEIYRKIDSEAALTRVKAKIKEKRKGKVIALFSKTLKYAAILLLIGSGSFLIYQKYTTEEQKLSASNEAEVHIDEESSPFMAIEPGTKKAVLILADGEEIDLTRQEQKLIQLSGVAIKNNQNILTYESTLSDGSSVEELVYNTLRVPVGGEYQVHLPDGSKVWLNSATSLKYPVSFASDQRVVYLQGEAYFEVKKDSRQFVVKTGDVDVKVLGTEFNLNAYSEDGAIATTLVEGKVKMSSQKGESEAVITPGKQAVYDRISKNIEVRNVEVDEFIAWKDGKFFFQKEELGNILIKLGRWYDIQIEYETPDLKSKVFTGIVLKDKPLNYILDLISKTSNVKYKIDNKKVIIAAKQ